jgi:GNAT superfamily N-acetyltransferase
MSFTIHHRNPTLAEYQELRQRVSWPAFDDALAQAGLSRSLFGVVVQNEEGHTVGMGRIVGDDALYFNIHDVIVVPECQRQGVGKMILKALLAYTDKKGGKNSQIGLSASKGREPFYRALGFTERPTDRLGAGMVLVKK